MRIDLTYRWSRSLFLTAVVLVAGPLILICGKVWLAEHWNGSSRPELWRKAAKLEPGDADYWRHLGLYKQLGMDDSSNPQPIVYLQRAARTDPRSAELWMDFADSYETAGEPRRAQQAYERAQRNYPMSAEVAWRYGSFLLFQKNFAQGYSEIRRAVRVEPSLTPSAIAECWQANPEIGALLGQMLPAQSQYFATAMDFFLSQNLLDPALAVWNRELTLSMPVQMRQAIPLVDALIGQNRLAKAEQTWYQALRVARWLQDPSDGSSIVFNGGFEHKIVGGGFGWREIPVDGVTYVQDSNIVHSGSHSLRVDFSGSTNVDFQNVFELVSVQPQTRYQFSAYVRTQEISTDQGIRFQIFDPQHPSEPQVLTPNMIGTNRWTLVGSTLTTGKDTHVLEISLRRIFTWKFDNKIRGTVWVDDVALSLVSTQAKGRVR
jgi:tetratricopeptide (TPR) repeat protein